MQHPLRTIAPGLILAAVLLLVPRLDLRAQDGEACPICNLWEDLTDLYDKVTDAQDFYSNYTECRAGGHSNETCLGAATLCLAQSNAPLDALGVVGSFYDSFGLMDLFQVNCGDGICFACCKTSAQDGCHTSFQEGDNGPPINCNPENAATPGARIVGNALLLDAQPGQPCLTTPQICVHIPICALTGGSNKTDSPVDQIDDINNDPDHPIKLQRARERRRRDYAEQAGKAWLALLRDTSTRSASPDTLPQGLLTLRDLRDFATARGCLGWRTRLRLATETGLWDDPLLEVLDENDLATPEAGHLKGLYQLGLGRFLASIPNGVARLDSIESWIWKDETRDAYLAGIGDADRVLLDQMGPIGLEILRRVNILQDYRLMAVPLTDEFTDPNVYLGCQLGAPPIVTLASTSEPNGVVRLKVELSDIENPALPIPVVIFWGDGAIERETVPPGLSETEFTHAYADQGSYQSYVVAENESGLRGVAALPIRVIGSDEVGEHRASPSIVRLVDAAVFNKFRSAAGTMYTSLSLEAVDAEGNAVEIGVGNGSWNTFTVGGDVVELGSLDGQLPAGAPLSRLRIRHSLATAIAIGEPETRVYAAGLELHVLNAATNQTVARPIAIRPEWVKLYRFDSDVPEPIAAAIYDGAGRLGIPLTGTDATPYRLVEIDFPDSLFTSLVIDPEADPLWVGTEGSWLEISPDRFVPADVVMSGRESYEVPDGFTLEQNYPNPFTASTTISFSLSSAETVRLEVFDLLGRSVANLLNERRPPGLHDIIWNASELPGGLYFYRLDAGTRSQTRHLVRIR